MKYIHAGHRKRLRELIKCIDLQNLSDLHFLEHLLTFTIPRIDTNPIAHALLDEFNTLDAIFEASPEALMRVKGIGEKTANFLSYMAATIYVYDRAKALKKPRTKNLSSTVNFINSVLPPTTNEQFIVLILNKNYEVKNYKIFEGVNHSAIEFDFNIFLTYLLQYKAHFCIIAHTHPKHCANPSEADLNMFSIIRNNIEAMKITLVDNIIIATNELYSEKSKDIVKYNDFLEYNYETNTKSYVIENEDCCFLET